MNYCSRGQRKCEILSSVVRRSFLNTGHSSFGDFSHHVTTNTIGPIVTAQKLLSANIAIGTVVFMSSDSGSAINFRDFEDGYVANLVTN